MRNSTLTKLYDLIEGDLLDDTRPSATITEMLVKEELELEELVRPAQPTINKLFNFRFKYSDYLTTYQNPESEVPIEMLEDFKPFLAWYKTKADIQ